MQSWDELKSACGECRGCELYKTRTNLVFGTGNENADLMFVGEAPGEQEDMTGIPFVGKAGQLLDKYLYAVDIPRESVYIANILKCRPPHNRDPEESEKDACIEHLRGQLQLIKPKIIVCLGRISAARLIHPDFKITREHGRFFKKGNYIFTAVYHPSALLREVGAQKREEMLVDLKLIKAELDKLTHVNSKED